MKKITLLRYLIFLIILFSFILCIFPIKIWAAPVNPDSTGNLKDKNINIIIPEIKKDVFLYQLISQDLKNILTSAGVKTSSIFKDTDEIPSSDLDIIIGNPEINGRTKTLEEKGLFHFDSSFPEEAYLIKNIQEGGRTQIIISGKDELGDAYGVYKLIDYIRTESSLDSLDIYRTPKVKYRFVETMAPFVDPEIYPLAWGMPFEQLDEAKYPYVNEEHFAASVRRFKEYLRIILSQGYNGIFVDDLIHLVNFDSIGSGYEIYPKNSPYRLRHENYQKYFREIFAFAKELHFQIYIGTEMIPYTPQVKKYIGDLSPGNPRLWQVVRALEEEAFNTFPNYIDGLRVRIGEGGGAYNFPNVGYYSKVIFKDVSSVKRLIKELLVPIEKFNKKLIFRTWTVGIGEIGQLHTSKELYHQVFDDIKSDHIIVSIKYCNSDFFRYLPFNETIGEGNLPQMVEYQMRREFEGMNIFPNYMGPIYQDSLKYSLTKGKVVGAWAWEQYGGWFGPFNVVYNTGFWLWIDANSYMMGRLSWDPEEDLTKITEDWAFINFGKDFAHQMSQILFLSDRAVAKGLYIPSFAKEKTIVKGALLPNMLWVMWNVPISASPALALIYLKSRNNIKSDVQSGFEAIKDVDEMIKLASGMKAENKEKYQLALGSLEYEKSLFEVLAWYKTSFLWYYHFSATGSKEAQKEYEGALKNLKLAKNNYLNKYKDNKIFSTYNLREIDAFIYRAENTSTSRIFSMIFFFLSLLALVILLIKKLLPNKDKSILIALRIASVLFFAVFILTLNYFYSSIKILFYFIIIYLLFFWLGLSLYYLTGKLMKGQARAINIITPSRLGLIFSFSLLTLLFGMTILINPLRTMIYIVDKVISNPAELWWIGLVVILLILIRFFITFREIRDKNKVSNLRALGILLISYSALLIILFVVVEMIGLSPIIKEANLLFNFLPTIINEAGMKITELI